MSSRYQILCLSHDPAIVVSAEFHWNTPAPALAAIAERAGPAEMHKTCDLLVGRYSYPLIEVCCSASRSNGPDHGSSHRSDEWLDASWLRLLALADPGVAVAARVRSCWSPEMARRLRYELGIGATDDTA